MTYDIHLDDETISISNVGQITATNEGVLSIHNHDDVLVFACPYI